MNHSTDIVIIGGGIIGCSIAFFLRKRGANVVVLEKSSIGSQASSAAAGLLAPIRPLMKENAFKDFQLAGIARLEKVIPELEECSQIPTEYAKTGTLRILPADRIAPAREWVRTWRPGEFEIEMLSAEEMHEQEPLLAPDLQAAVCVRDEGQVTPVRLMQAYAQAASNKGAVLISHAEVVGVQRSDRGESVTKVLTEQGDSFSCKQVIVALGAWSAQCSQWFNYTVPIKPVRGEIVALQQPRPAIRHIIFDEGLYDEDIYVAPKPDGTVIVGATKSDVGFDTSVSAGGLLHLLDVATRLIPELKQCAVQRYWAGLRPKTNNSAPLLGPLPGWENVTIASGHGGFGIMLSAITGETIAEYIVTGTIPQALRAFLPREQ